MVLTANDDGESAVRVERKRNIRYASLVCLLLLVLLCVGIVIWLSTKCWTSRCRIGRRVASHMNFAVDPCQDFYNFSCGGWVQKTELPAGPGQTVGTGLYHVHHENARKVEELVFQPVKRNYEKSSERKVKTLADQCIKAPQHENRIKEQVKSVLRDMVGAYPLPLDRVSDKWNLTHALQVALLQLKAEALFEFAPLRDILGDERLVLALDQSGLSLSHPKFYKDAQRVTQLREVVRVIGYYLDMTASEADSFAWKAIDFERKLAQFSKGQDDESRLNLTALYGKRNLGVVCKEFDSVDLMRLFQSAGYRVDESYDVIVTDIEYFKRLNELLKIEDQTEIQCYLVLQMINKLAYILPGSFPYDMISKEKYREYCVQLVTTEMMPASTGALYVEEHFSADAKHAVEEMIENIKNILMEQISRLDWMSEETKRRAVGKAKQMLTKMGYPEQLMNTTVMDDSVASFRVDEDDTIFQSWINWSQFYFREASRFLGDTTEREEWHNINAAVVNAFNDLAKNSIEFPAGVFETPLFDIEAPSYMNYGAIGAIIGHEITHGFDRSGMQFDAEGNMVNWWSNSSAAQYEKKSQCYVKHYGKFTAGGVAVNPLLSLGENVADAGGLKLAKLAYERSRIAPKKSIGQSDASSSSSSSSSSRSAAGKEESLPGFERFTPQQLFYVAFAQAWCDKTSAFQLEQTLSSDPHLPGEPRVSGAIALQPDFAKAFNCPKGSAMNPVEQCSMWSNKRK